LPQNSKSRKTNIENINDQICINSENNNNNYYYLFISQKKNTGLN